MNYIPTTKRFKTYSDLMDDYEVEQVTGLTSKTLAVVEQNEIRELVKKLLAYADSPEDMILKIQQVISLSLQNTSIKGLSKIKVLKAELNRQMYEMAGADTGYYKNDYAVFMQAKQDEVMGDLLDKMEFEINRLKEYINSTEI